MVLLCPGLVMQAIGIMARCEKQPEPRKYCLVNIMNYEKEGAWKPPTNDFHALSVYVRKCLRTIFDHLLLFLL